MHSILENGQWAFLLKNYQNKSHLYKDILQTCVVDLRIQNDKKHIELLGNLKIEMTVLLLKVKKNSDQLYQISIKVIRNIDVSYNFNTV